MNIREAADASNLTPDTIRFYEKKGILPRPPRLPNGYRHYTEAHVATLRLAKGLRELELPLNEVAPILLIAHDGTCSEIRESMARAFTKALSNLGARIEELEQARDHLSSVLAGLRKMRRKDVSVPGVDACECVQMVAEGERV